MVFIFYLPTAGWLSYTSNRVPLSFKYPADWPVSVCAEDRIFFPEMKIDEAIQFENKCDWRASLISIGDITVQKLDNVTDPRKPASSPTVRVAGSNLKPVTIGNKPGYLLMYTPYNGTPSSINPVSRWETYYVIANNLVYTIRLSGHNFYKGSEAETTKTFEKILSTFQL